jgi:hypothetical protein
LLSRQLLSTTQPPLQIFCIGKKFGTSRGVNNGI